MRRTPLALSALLLWEAMSCAAAADRVHAGQWQTTVNVAGQSMSRSVCLSADDAALINGDAASIKAYAEKVGAPAGCKVKDVKINGDQVQITSICASGKENVGSTTYHGDRYEATNTNGAKAESRRVGDCK